MKERFSAPRFWVRLLVVLVMLVFYGSSMHVLAAPRTPTPTPIPSAAASPVVSSPTPTPTPVVEPSVPTPTTTPTSTPSPVSNTPTPTPTDTPSPAPTPTPTPALKLTGVEPSSFVAGVAGQISVYGEGFVPGTIVRLIGAGVLSSTVINSQVIQATLSPLLQPGTYGVEVIRPDGARAALENVLTLVAPTPVPSPTPTPGPPPPGRPILMISNYALRPLTAVPGHNLLVSVDIFNGGSRPAENALISFPGGVLIPVGETGHYVKHIPINGKVNVQQYFFVPEQLGAGTYQITVNMEGNDFEGKHYTYQGTVTVAVTEPPAKGQPHVVVNRASTRPERPRPGQPFSLNVQVENVGDAVAQDLVVVVKDDTLIVPGQEGNRYPIGELKAGASVTATLSLVLQENVSSGPHSLDVVLAYRDKEGNPLTVTEQVGITVQRGDMAPPRILIEAAHFQPEIPAPGDVVTFTLDMMNVGGQDARRVLVALGGSSGKALDAVALLDTGNVRYVADIPAGASTQVVQRLFISGSAQPGVYNLPIDLSYEDEQGNTLQDTQLVSLRVRRRPLLQVRFYEEVPPPRVGQPFRLPIELTNLAPTGLNVTTLEARSETLDIRDGSVFVGYLDGSSTTSLDATAVARTPGTHVVQVLVHYVDDFGRLSVWQSELTVQVQAVRPTPTPLPGQAAGPAAAQKEEGILQKIWRAIRGLLGLGS